MLYIELCTLTTYSPFKEAHTTTESIFFYQPIDGKRVQLSSMLFSSELRATRLFFTKKSGKQNNLLPSSPDSFPADSCFPAEISICSSKVVPGLYSGNTGVRHLFPQSSALLTMIWYFQTTEVWYSSAECLTS